FSFFVLSFFFQAEDGIRDPLVTGVQTCALPISCLPSRSAAVPRIWLTVTTPVPPMPVMKIDAARFTFRAGSGSGWSTANVFRSRFFGVPRGTTVTKDGQSPRRQE